jgi:predicted phage terminase large subunit-like protein
MITDIDKLEAEREYCSRSLFHFVKRAWPTLEPAQDLKLGWVLEAICEHLEAVHRGEITRLLMNVPFGTMKSLLTGVLAPAWEWGPKNMPGMRWMGASHERELAIRDNLRMRNLIQSEWYQQLWPIQLTGDQNQKTYFVNTSTGWRQACSARSMTGRRADRVLWDDPQPTAEGDSEAATDSMENIFRGTLPSRLVDPDLSAIIIIMQRVGPKDASALALAEDYYHCLYPMEFDPSRKCISIYYPDPRTKEKELLFPERYPQHVVDRDKKVMGSRRWETQANQRPSVEGGEIIKPKDFKYYQILPKGDILSRKIYCDTAQKDKEEHDYSVLAVWGEHRNGHAYLIDLLRGKWLAPELDRQLRAFWAKHKAWDSVFYGPLNEIVMEDKASGTGAIQYIKERGGIPIRGVEPEKNKFTRVNNVLPYIENGCVFLPDGAHFISDFIVECEQFTANDKHPHDDQIDTMVMAIDDICNRSNNCWVENL